MLLCLLLFDDAALQKMSAAAPVAAPVNTRPPTRFKTAAAVVVGAWGLLLVFVQPRGNG